MFGIFRKRPECFRFPEIGHEYFCLSWFVCFVLIVDRHHIDYRTLGSQAAANLLGEVSNKIIIIVIITLLMCLQGFSIAAKWYYEYILYRRRDFKTQLYFYG